ncbi:MAG TPA: hypothetical protein VF753_17375 [Terriglobales bacterium]
MARLRFFPLLVLSVLLTGCGQIYVSAYWNQPPPPPPNTHFNGNVAAVEIQLRDDGSSVRDYTVVTLRQSNKLTVLRFCGPHGSEFPISADEMVSVELAPGKDCAQLKSVRVIQQSRAE